jgi:mannose-1-phosphate guanylyltransferase
LPTKIDPWCVVLAARSGAQYRADSIANRTAPLIPAPAARDPIRETLRRARTFAPIECIGAVLAAACGDLSQAGMDRIDPNHIVAEPVHRGTGYEILLALLSLESRVEAMAPIIFLPADHIVSDERVVSDALANMVGWIGREPGLVYLFGTVPEGPHNQLGYIVPWLETSLLPTSVYEFVEMPDVRTARSLINSGGLWNTFMFGGTRASIMQLFKPHYDTQIKAIREALAQDRGGACKLESSALTRVFSALQPIDFSRDILKNRLDRLNVLRLPPCGWWPLRSPRFDAVSGARPPVGGR